MYCKVCGSNEAFEAQDVNFCRKILVCPDCKNVSWPVPSTEELARDVERMTKNIQALKTTLNMPETEESE